MPNTLISKLENVVRRSPNKEAFIYFSEGIYKSIIYKDFYDKLQRVAAYIADLGTVKGSKIAIMLENSPEWAIVYFGIIFSGCIAVPLDVQDSQENIKNILTDSEAAYIFTSEGQAERLESVVRTLPSKPLIASEILNNCKRDNLFKVPQICETDIASLLYTSGTTQTPKGVMLTHKNLISNFDSINLTGLCTENDKMVSCLPLFHSYPFMVTLILPLLTGATVVFSPSLKGEDLIGSIKDNNATIFVGVPELFAVMYKKMIQKIYSINALLRFFLKPFLKQKIHKVFGGNFRFFASGGARLDPKVAKGLFKLGFTILEGYGLTETSPVVTFNPINKPKIGSVGIPIPGVEVKIDNPSSLGIGEILIKGDNVMTGYYKRKEQTNDAIKNGWFYSGDLGYMNKDGYLFITGRKKELIVLSSGKNIYPEDIESYYKRSEFIKEICVFDPAVFGKPETGIFALVVPNMDIFRRYGETDIDRVIRGKIEDLSKSAAPHTRITDFRIGLEELPKTRLGKIKRYEAEEVFKKIYETKLHGKYLPLTKEEEIFMQQPFSKAIIEYMRSERAFKGLLHPEDSLELGLGLDSLGRIELLSMLEHTFKISIPQKIAAGWFTIKDVVDGINNLKKELPSQEVTAQVASGKKLWQELLVRAPASTLLNKIDIAPGIWLKMLTFLVTKFLYFYFKIFYSLKIYGRENIPLQGPYILCINHTTYYDAFIIAASVPFKCEIDLYFMGFRGYFQLPIIRNTIRAARIIPVDTAKDLIPAMQAASYVLRNNKCLCVFPEGERSIDGKIKKFKNGVGILSKELNIPLVPVIIKGAYQAWPRTKPLPGRYPIKVIFAKPQGQGSLIEKGYLLKAQDDYQAITAGLKQIMLKMS